MLPALFKGWIAGTVLYNIFLMSGVAWSGAVAFTGEISTPRPGSISFEKETFRTTVNGANYFTARSLDAYLIFDRSLRLLNKKNNGSCVSTVGEQLQLPYFHFGGDTKNYFSNLKCHLTGIVLISVV